MKYKYLLFGVYNYYPSGGMDDLLFKFNSIEDIQDKFAFDYEDTFQIVDTNTFNFFEIIVRDVVNVYESNYTTEEIREIILNEIKKYL